VSTQSPWEGPIRWIAIVGLCLVAAIAYGIVHDQITARICLEYFTIGHPRIFNTESPTLLALAWGVIATWWAGFLLGWPLAFAARAGHGPRRDPQSLVRPIGLLLAVMAISAALAGLIGYWLAKSGAIYLLGPLADRIPRNRHAAFLADLWTHLASYAVGFVGGIIVIIRVRLSRRSIRAGKDGKALVVGLDLE
jgi:hypothetical protein